MEAKFKNDYRQKAINMISKLLDEHPVSDEFVHISCEDKFFKDSVNFVDLIYQLSEIKSALQTAIKYSDC